MRLLPSLPPLSLPSIPPPLSPPSAPAPLSPPSAPAPLPPSAPALLSPPSAPALLSPPSAPAPLSPSQSLKPAPAPFVFAPQTIENEEDTEEEENEDSMIIDFSILEQNGYQVGEELGKGAYAVVRKCQKSNAEYAVKMINKEVSSQFNQTALKNELEVLSTKQTSF